MNSALPCSRIPDSVILKLPMPCWKRGIDDTFMSDFIGKSILRMSVISGVVIQFWCDILIP